MALVNNKFLVSAAFAANASLSAQVGIAPYTLVGIASDANWTPELVSFLTSNDGVNWLNVQNNAGPLSYGPLGASSYMALDPAIFRGVQLIQVRSGAAGSAVNQTNATVLTLIGQGVC